MARYRSSMSGPSADEEPDPGVGVPDEVDAAGAHEQDPRSEKPGWIDRFVWQTLWKVVAV